MQYQNLFACAVGGGISGFGIFALIALLACLLCAELACIYILVKKLRRADKTENVDEDDLYMDRGAVLLAPLTALPGIAFYTFSILAIACALAAIALVALLIYAFYHGYRFHFAGEADEELAFQASAEETAQPEESYEDEAEEGEEIIQEPYAADGEAQMQENYTDALDRPEEEVPSETVSEVVAETVTVTPVETISSVPMGAPVDPTQPYKVVEKVVTETYKEVIKEAPAAAPQPTSTDALLEKLSDFLDYEMKKRKDNESISTMASIDGEDAEEDEEDDDLIDPDDAAEEGESEDDGADNDVFTGNERIIGFDETTGCYIVAHYRKSFEAKLIQARPNIKKYYSDLKNALLSYKGSKDRISWSADSFHNGRQAIAKINVKTRILEIYLALDPASLEGTVYRGKDVGSKKKYADTPFQYKVRTPRKFKWAMELVQRTCEEHGLSPIDIEPVDYEALYPFDTTENLVARDLIKEYIRQEKPATSFELAPDHVPELPEEDGSVIPANANFLWEFDNDRMKEPEEEPTSIEEAPAKAPVTEEAPSEPAEAPVVRETVKVTEMRSTERYYTNAEPTYEEVITTTEPIAVSALPEEASEEIEEPISNEAEEAEEVEEAIETAVITDVEEDEEFEEEPAEEILEEEFSEEEETVEDNDLPWEDEETDAEDGEDDVVPIVVATPANATVATVDLRAIEAYYADGDTVNLETLKEKGLIQEEAETLKVQSSGALSKVLTVEANHFNMDAIIAISAAGGESTMIR